MSAGKLSSNEKTVFRRMYEDVAGGMVISLSKKQRAWADSVYSKHDLDNPKNRGMEPVALRTPKPAPVKAHYHATEKGRVQVEAFRRRAAELGFTEPVPNNDQLLQLVDRIPPEAQKAIASTAAEKGLSVEKVSVAYVRKLLELAIQDEQRFQS